MKTKLTLIYSPCQVSNHYQKTRQTVDWKIRSSSFERSGEPCELGTLQVTAELLVEVTFKCRTFQTDVPFNETLRCVLRALKLHHVLRQSTSVTLAMKNCPAECIKTVAMESLHWMNMVLRKCYDYDTGGIFCNLKAPRRMIENLTPSQVYQKSMLNWLQRASSEIALPIKSMRSRLLGVHLATWTEHYGSGRNVMQIRISHHKTNSLDISLIQRESHLVLLLRIASYVAFAKPLSERTRGDSLVIKIEICDKCIPVVVSALKYLLNTLSYFHAFLPFNCSMHIKPSSCAFSWKSMWPLQRFDIPDILFHYIDRSHIQLHVCVCAESAQLDLNYPMLPIGYISYFRDTRRYKSHSKLLPKS